MTLAVTLKSFTNSVPVIEGCGTFAPPDVGEPDFLGVSYINLIIPEQVSLLQLAFGMNVSGTRITLRSREEV